MHLARRGSGHIIHFKFVDSGRRQCGACNLWLKGSDRLIARIGSYEKGGEITEYSCVPMHQIHPWMTNQSDE